MAVEDLRSSRSSIPCASARLWIVTATVLLSRVSPIQTQFTPPSNVSCACRGEELTFWCTVVGGAATVWNGTAFTCVQRDIALVHDVGRHEAECNDILGQLIPGEDQRFTSNVKLNVSNDLNGTTVRCSLSSGSSVDPVGSSSILVRSTSYDESPAVMLMAANASKLTFTWNSVDPNCPTISYEMTTSDSGCGTCSIATDTTTGRATCTGLQLGSMCTFSVRSAICGFTGMPSNTVVVAIRVPDPPQVAIIPVYTADTNNLAKLNITINRAIDSVTDPLFGAVTEYITSYPGGMQRNPSCTDDQCEYEVGGAFQDCATSSSSTAVTVSAVNVFGQGQASMPQTFGCTNEFVRVEYVAASSVITCNFLDTTDTSVKSCTVMYGQCGQELEQKARRNSTLEAPNFVTLQLVPNDGSDCYSVTAHSNTFTVIVDSRITAPQGSDSTIVIAIAVPIAIIFPAVVIIVVVILSICGYVCCKRSSKDNVPEPKPSRDMNIPLAASNPQVTNNDQVLVDTEFREGVKLKAAQTSRQ